MANHTQLRAVNNEGDTVDLQHTSTDSPILPASNLEQLHRLDPSLVQFVVEQTKLEAEHRRATQKKTNSYIFIERISGVVAGAVVAIFGLGAGAFAIIKGHDWAGAALCGVTLVTIVTVLVTKKNNQKEDSPKASTRRARKK